MWKNVTWLITTKWSEFRWYEIYSPQDPWDLYIYLHLYTIKMNQMYVAIPYMDGVGSRFLTSSVGPWGYEIQVKNLGWSEKMVHDFIVVRRPNFHDFLPGHHGKSLSGHPKEPLNTKGSSKLAGPPCETTSVMRLSGAGGPLGWHRSLNPLNEDLISFGGSLGGTLKFPC